MFAIDYQQESLNNDDVVKLRTERRWCRDLCHVTAETRKHH